MKKVIITSLIIGVINTTGKIRAQELSINVSKDELRTKENGYFDGLSKVTSKYVYVDYKGKKSKFISIAAYDKTTLKKVGEKLFGTNDENGKYKKIELEKVLYFDDAVYMFWKDKKPDKELALYLEVFSPEMKSMKKLTKIYAVANNKKIPPAFFVVGNSKIGKLLIGAELSREKEENVKLEYKVLNNDLSYGASGQIDLPVKTPKISTKTDNLVSSYLYGENNMLYIFTNIKNEEDNSKIKYYTLLTILNPVLNVYKSVSIKADSKKLYDIGILVNSGETYITALYSDLTKDPSGNDIHGIFLGSIDNELMAFNNTNFIPFGKEFLDKLFESDKADKNKAGFLSSKKKKKSAEESISGTYNIMKIFKGEGNFIYLVAGKFLTYTERVCYTTGNSYQCYTNTYTNAGNVLAFKINTQGTIEWGNLIKRDKIYLGVVNNDMSLFLYNNKIYGFIPDLEPIDPNLSKKQKKNLMKEASKLISYAVIDGNTGSVKIQRQRIGYLNDKDDKYFNYLGIKDDDEKNLYSILYSSNKEKKRLYTSWAMLSCIIPPVGIIALPIVLSIPIKENINLIKISLQ